MSPVGGVSEYEEHLLPGLKSDWSQYTSLRRMSHKASILPKRMEVEAAGSPPSDTTVLRRIRASSRGQLTPVAGEDRIGLQGGGGCPQTARSHSTGRGIPH